MLNFWLARWARLAGALLTGAALVAVALPAGATPASAATTAKLKVISYRGYRFSVPAAWPVLNLTRHPATCVRFDLHAVYLGKPGANQNCPSWLLGATEAIVIEPGPRTASRATDEDPVSNEITAVGPGVAVTATFGADPATIDAILASAGLAAPTVTQPDPTSLASGAPVRTSTGSAAAAISASGALLAGAGADIANPALPATVANRVGLGFDVCAAPSGATMRAWMKHSSYRAVGIYIGGADRACDQQNLTPTWVRNQARDGWRFVPMYAGPQAAFGQLTSAASQGTSAARDAVQAAERLGFGPRTPLYYDMEAYSPSATGNALRFLSAWTTELHKLGYKSGVYSSSSSAIADLAQVYKGGKFAMPDVIYDALWNGARNTADSKAYKSGEWTGGRRLHQFSGDVLQAHGGHTLDIDQDYLDVSLAAPGGTTQASAGATISSSSATVFYKGSNDHLYQDSRNSAGNWTRTNLGQHLTSAPSVVRVGSANLDVFYRGRKDYLWELTRTGGRWHKAVRRTRMGAVGQPKAVAQPNGVVDVFWAGTHDDHLWHGQYSPAKGWGGPQNLGGRLDSAPYPVETKSGEVQVFFKGTDGHLWHVVRRVGGRWGNPADLGMGKLGGGPRAVAMSDGEIDVFWRGSTAPHIVWSARLIPGHHVKGPLRRGGHITGAPWPVIGAGGTERVLFRGTDGHLWALLRGPQNHWAKAAKVTKLGRISSAPFAGAGPTSAGLQVFWTGKKHRLWTAELTAPGGWHRGFDLGGSA